MYYEIDVKPGVVFQKLRSEIVWAVQVVAIIFAAHGLVATVTSANDSKHSPKSLHYKDRALDIRLKDVPKPLRVQLHKFIATALGDKYDVLYEFVDHPTNVHLHIEWDPS